jgi:hypothetical protein
MGKTKAQEEAAALQEIQIGKNIAVQVMREHRHLLVQQWCALDPRSECREY